MKRLLLLMMCAISALIVAAQRTVTLKAGTLIQVRNEHHLKAADAQIGQQVLFKVTRDVEANGVVVIPAGTPVTGVVYEAKKSSMWGTKGRLGITIQEIQLPDGARVALNKRDIYITGKNRTALACVSAIFYVLPGFLITGSRAEIPAGYEATAEVAWPVEINVSGRSRYDNFSNVSSQSGQAAQQVKRNSSLPEFPFAATLIKTDGSAIDVIVHNIENGVVSYKKASNSNGPMYKQEMSTIKEIAVKYE